MTWPKRISAIVTERSGGICEGCGKREATNIHHRQYKSRGGKDLVVNALHLCGMGNIRSAGCHGVAHSGEGHELGWSVNSWGDPKLTPALYRGELMWLTDDGRVVSVKPEPAF